MQPRQCSDKGAALQLLWQSGAESAHTRLRDAGPTAPPTPSSYLAHSSSQVLLQSALFRGWPTLHPCCWNCQSTALELLRK